MRGHAGSFDSASIQTKNRRMLVALVLIALFLAGGAAAFIVWSKGRVKMTEPFHSELWPAAAPSSGPHDGRPVMPGPLSAVC
jgi:uncharacterized membrane protein